MVIFGNGKILQWQFLVVILRRQRMVKFGSYVKLQIENHDGK